VMMRRDNNATLRSEATSGKVGRGAGPDAAASIRL